MYNMKSCERLSVECVRWCAQTFSTRCLCPFFSHCLIDIQTLQASYEDEEDAYHARPDPYHEPAHHRYDSDYGMSYCLAI